MIAVPIQPPICPGGTKPASDFDKKCLWTNPSGGAEVFVPNEGSQPVPGIADQIQSIVTAPVDAATSGIFDGFAQTMARAFADILQATLTWWLGPSGVALKPLLRTLADPSGRNPAGLLAWVAAVVAVFALITAAINLMLRRRLDDAINIGIGLFKFALVYTAGWTVLLGLWNLADELTNTILGDKGTADLSAPFISLTLASAVNPASSGLMIVVGLIGAILGLFLFFAMLFRTAAIVILAIALPLAAAGAVGSGATKEWLPKVTGWLLALIFFRPLAALIYTIGLEVMTRSNGADPMMGLLIGVAIIGTALVSLGALMKLLTWTTGAAMGAGGGAGMALAGAGVAGGMLLRSPGAGAVAASDITPTPPWGNGAPSGGAPPGFGSGPPPGIGPGTGGGSGAAGTPASASRAFGSGPEAGGRGSNAEEDSAPTSPDGARTPANLGGNQVGQATAGRGDGGSAGAGTAAANGTAGAATATGGPVSLGVATAIQAVNLGSQVVTAAANEPASELG